jgi:hypothetical protein
MAVQKVRPHLLLNAAADVQKICATDIRNCEQFKVMAQSGSISGWHVDHVGVTTHVTVAPNGYTARP